MTPSNEGSRYPYVVNTVLSGLFGFAVGKILEINHFVDRPISIESGLGLAAIALVSTLIYHSITGKT